MDYLTEEQALELYNVTPKYSTGTRIYDRANKSFGIVKRYEFVIDPFNGKDLIIMLWYHITNDKGIKNGYVKRVREDCTKPALKYLEDKITNLNEELNKAKELQKHYNTLDK